MKCGYFDKVTGEVCLVVVGPDDCVFHDPKENQLAVFLAPEQDMPGYVVDGIFYSKPIQPSKAHTWDYITKQWIFSAEKQSEVIIATRNAALNTIDNESGKVRLRYITSVPGQAETYQKKEQQARDWAAASFAGDPPSFIAAEATALGRDPQAVATEVIGLADYWGNIKGPQIEAARRKWKVAIEAATDATQVDSMLASARSELGAL